ncbi:MAG TPA: hypothetical protein VFN10_05460 [Thermoanaerobaculia bacterium]|nr:hypothetical protein [Thermoanaerobaculia bacterium]
MLPARKVIPLVLKRGLRRRCPRCGEGQLFRRMIEAYDRCPVCGVLYQRNYGDIWMFVIITDRLPIMAGVVAIFFGFRSASMPNAFLFFAILAVPLAVTFRERQGLALALDYLWRIYIPDPSDEIHDGRGAVIVPARPPQ